jgi:hypothetical protein
MFPQNSYVEILTPKVTGNRASAEVIMVNWARKGRS